MGETNLRLRVLRSVRVRYFDVQKLGGGDLRVKLKGGPHSTA